MNKFLSGWMTTSWIYILRFNTNITAKKKKHYPGSLWKQFGCTLSLLLPEGLESNQPVCEIWLQSSQEPKRTGGQVPYLLQLVHSNSKKKSPASSWKEVYHTSSTLTVVAATWKKAPKSPISGRLYRAWHLWIPQEYTQKKRWFYMTA